MRVWEDEVSEVEEEDEEKEGGESAICLNCNLVDRQFPEFRFLFTKMCEEQFLL